jgi:SAM-dependent methyltransferase
MWILVAILFILVLSFAYAAVKGAPWVPTRARDFDRLVKLIDVKPGQKVYELGAGDGRVSVLIAKRTGATMVGIELSIAQYIAACFRRILSRVPNVYFSLGNAFNVNLSDADAVYLFLMPDAYAKLKPKFEKELKPGAKVITYVWPMEGWTPTVVDKVEGTQTLYLYVR